MIEHFSDDLINHHLDAVLRASGSGLRYYSMYSTLDAMREAMNEAMLAAVRRALSEDLV